MQPPRWILTLCFIPLISTLSNTRKEVNEYLLMNENPNLSPNPVHVPPSSHTLISKGVHIFLLIPCLAIIPGWSVHGQLKQTLVLMEVQHSLVLGMFWCAFLFRSGLLPVYLPFAPAHLSVLICLHLLPEPSTYIPGVSGSGRRQLKWKLWRHQGWPCCVSKYHQVCGLSGTSGRQMLPSETSKAKSPKSSYELSLHMKSPGIRQGKDQNMHPLRE